MMIMMTTMIMIGSVIRVSAMNMIYWKSDKFWLGKLCIY